VGRVYHSNEGIGVLLVLSPAAATTLADILTNWSKQLESFQHRELFLLELTAQAADGLSHMHSKGVMHRDIKPENLAFVTINPVHLVILDLGAAEHKKKSTNHKLGTTWYFAPELWAVKEGRSSEPFDNKVDMFALGATLYNLLLMKTSPKAVGRLNHKHFCAPPCIIKKQEGKKDQDMPRVWKLAQRLLTQDPEKRPSATEVLEWIQPHLREASANAARACEERNGKRRRGLISL
jgi:serine/threonine protein kinase